MSVELVEPSQVKSAIQAPPHCTPHIQLVRYALMSVELGCPLASQSARHWQRSSTASRPLLLIPSGRKQSRAGFGAISKASGVPLALQSVQPGRWTGAESRPKTKWDVAAEP